MDALNRAVNPLLLPFTKSPLSFLLALFIAVYGGKAAPKPPQFMKDLFDSAIFRVAVLFLILWVGNRDPALSIMSVLTFVAVLNLTSGRSLFEMFDYEYAPTVMPAQCLNVTMYDILAAFNNDKDKAIEAMVKAGVPTSVRLDAYYAPLISAYLTSAGYQITKTCGPPS